MPKTTLVGCDQHGSFFKINPTTGVGALVGATGFWTNSLACDGSGKLFSVAAAGTGMGLLITIDPQTGAGTPVKQLQLLTDIRDLAFSPKNVPFAIKDRGEHDPTVRLPHDLVTIEVTTGAVTLVGNTNQQGIQGIAFSPDGTLFGWDMFRGLAKFNITTGQATLVNPTATPGSFPDIQGLAFAPNGTLFGARESLFTINVTTGTPILIGSGGYSDVRGIAFLSHHPPPKHGHGKKRGIG